jgi:hypothetical protein
MKWWHVRDVLGCSCCSQCGCAGPLLVGQQTPAAGVGTLTGTCAAHSYSHSWCWYSRHHSAGSHGGTGPLPCLLLPPRPHLHVPPPMCVSPLRCMWWVAQHLTEGDGTRCGSHAICRSHPSRHGATAVAAAAAPAAAWQAAAVQAGASGGTKESCTPM